MHAMATVLMLTIGHGLRIVSQLNPASSLNGYALAFQNNEGNLS